MYPELKVQILFRPVLPPATNIFLSAIIAQVQLRHGVGKSPTFTHSPVSGWKRWIAVMS